MLFSPACGLVQLSSVIVIKVCRREALFRQEKSKPPQLPVTLRRCEIWAGKESQADSQKWPEILLRREGLQQRRQLLLISNSCPKRRHNSTTALRSQWELLSFQIPMKSWSTRQQPVCQGAFQIKGVQSHGVSRLWAQAFPPAAHLSLENLCNLSLCNLQLTTGTGAQAESILHWVLINFWVKCACFWLQWENGCYFPVLTYPHLSLHSQAWPWKWDFITAAIPSPGGNELKKGFISFFNSKQANNNKMHLGNIIERNSSLLMKLKMIVF